MVIVFARSRDSRFGVREAEKDKKTEGDFTGKHSMEIQILSVGRIKENYWKTAEQEFSRRIQRYSKFSSAFVKDAVWESLKNNALVRQTEGRLLLQKIGSDFVVALDKRGRQMPSERFAEFLQQHMNRGTRKITFVIGGPLGLADEVLERAEIVLSLSEMTFLHEMSRIILLEQIYRAFTILKGAKYHK